MIVTIKSSIIIICFRLLVILISFIIVLSSYQY